MSLIERPTEEDALDALNAAARYCYEADRDGLGDEINALYQQVAGTDAGAHAGVGRWIELACPGCGHDGGFDGWGLSKRGRRLRYEHHCPDCGTVVGVPVTIDGETIGTR